LWRSQNIPPTICLQFIAVSISFSHTATHHTTSTVTTEAKPMFIVTKGVHITMATGNHRKRGETSHTNQALKEPWKQLKWQLGCDSLTQQYYVLLTCPWYDGLLKYSRSTPRPFSWVLSLFWEQTKRKFHVTWCCNILTLCCIICCILDYFFSLGSYLAQNALCCNYTTVYSASTCNSQKTRPMWASSVTMSSEVWLTHTTVLHIVILLYLKLSKPLPLLLLLLLLLI